MDNIKILLNVVLILYYFYNYFSFLKKKLFVEAIIITVLYPTIAGIIGFSNFKTIIYLFLLLLLTGIIIISKKSISKIDVTPLKIIYLFFLFSFFFLFIIKSVFTPAIGSTYYNNKLLFSILLLIFPVILFFYPNHKPIEGNKIVLFFIYSSTIVALILFINAYQIGFSNIFKGRFFPRISTNEQANVIWIGRFLSIGFILNLIFTNNNIKKFGIAAIILGAMFFTGSKSVLLFTIVSLFIYYNFISSTKSIKKKFKNFALILVVVGFIGYLMISLNPQALERRFSSKSGTIDQRTGRIENVLNGYLENRNYFFGNGLGSVTYPLTNDYSLRDYPHNMLIEILYEFGVIGLILYICLLLTPIVFFLLKKKRAKYISAFVTINILFIFYAQTSGDLFSNNLPFIFGAFILFLIPNYIEKDENSIYI